MVDPALLRQAADRGVTICFADLDGADGLWVPEERTVLVSRQLSEREVARVIEHELTHVAIDDQHADLDAGRDVVIGHHPVRSGRSRVLTALTVSALFAVVGGVSLGLAWATDEPTGPGPVVAPSPDRPVTAPETAAVGAPLVTTTPSVGADGRTVVITITLTASPSLPLASTLAGPATTAPTRTTAAPSRAATAPGAGSTVSVQVTETTSAQPPTTTVPPTPTTPAPTTEATDDTEPDPLPGAGEGGGAGDAADTGALPDSAVPGTAEGTD